MTAQRLTCHSLLLTAPRTLQWCAEELPELQPHEILVQTRASAISIGTELPHYRGISRHSRSRPYPYMTGYESIGRVIACGSAVQSFRVEDRVVAFFGHRTYAHVPEAKAIPVPEHIPDPVALLAILTCDVAKGIGKVAPKSDEPVLVSGAGTIGLLTVFLLKALGVTTVDVAEPQAERYALALKLGARQAKEPRYFMEQQTDQLYPIGIECASRDASFGLLQERLQAHGRLCVLADGNLEPLVLRPAFHEKELTIVGSSDGLDYQEHAHWFFQQDTEQLHTLSLLFDYQTTSNQLSSVFAGLADHTIKATKVIAWYNEPVG